MRELVGPFDPDAFSNITHEDTEDLDLGPCIMEWEEQAEVRAGLWDDPDNVPPIEFEPPDGELDPPALLVAEEGFQQLLSLWLRRCVVNGMSMKTSLFALTLDFSLDP